MYGHHHRKSLDGWSCETGSGQLFKVLVFRLKIGSSLNEPTFFSLWFLCL
jgi:hypothetical protein